MRFRSELGRAFHAVLIVEIAERKDALAKGMARDFAEYRHRAGQIAGLQDALEVFNRAERTLLQITDEDEET